MASLAHPPITPVGAADIAKRLKVKAQTVHMWRQRKVIPEPRWHVSGQPAWEWSEIEEWARRTHRLPDPNLHSALLDLEGSGWAGDLRSMREDRVPR